MQTHLAWQRTRRIQSDARQEIKTISEREMFLIGVALYWAEGYKKLKTKNGRVITSHPISFTNTDPIMIRSFIAFLQEIVRIPQKDIAASIRSFKHLNENDVLSYWMGETGLSTGNFKKVLYPVSRSSNGKRPYDRLPHGTIQISANSTENFHRMIGWIDGMKSCILSPKILR